MTEWYAACLRIWCLVEGRPGEENTLMRSVVIVQASSWEEAFQKALRAGYAQEESGTNSEGENVRWAFEEVETLDCLGEALHSGREVYSEFSTAMVETNWPDFHTIFKPDEKTGTGYSGV